MKRCIFYQQLQALGVEVATYDFYKNRNDTRFFEVVEMLLVDTDPSKSIIDFNSTLYSIRYSVLEVEANTYHCLVIKL